MRQKISNILLKIIVRIPSNALRVWFYRNVKKYTIGDNVTIGKKTIISCKEVEIGNNVKIDKNNAIACSVFKIGNGSAVLSGNVISGTSSFSMGSDSRIINDHFFDLWHPIVLGDRTWVAGKKSQFWTHGSLHTKTGKDLGITIGDDVYIGSSCLFAAGSQVASNNLIGLGSVVSGIFNDSDTVIAGNHAQVVKRNVNWRENW